jgi:hypothetical protein
MLGMLFASGFPLREGDVIQEKQIEEGKNDEQAKRRRKSSFLQNLPVRDDQQRKEEQYDDQVDWSE